MTKKLIVVGIIVTAIGTSTTAAVLLYQEHRQREVAAAIKRAELDEFTATRERMLTVFENATYNTTQEEVENVLGAPLHIDSKNLTVIWKKAGIQIEMFFCCTRTIHLLSRRSTTA
jgi:hypothetical protein